jgi:hypothetical protein
MLQIDIIAIDFKFWANIIISMIQCFIFSIIQCFSLVRKKRIIEKYRNWRIIFLNVALLDNFFKFVLANGFQKKTQKTPKKEIERVTKIKKEYECDKNA